MDSISVTIGTHNIQMIIDSKDLTDFIKQSYTIIQSENKPDIFLTIKQGYGIPFIDYQVEITKQDGKITFRRADYLIEVTTDYQSATIHAYDEFALKHAMTNLYSAFIVYKQWGLLIHSSCVIEDGKAHLFAGQSGAGKSTAAKLSSPRSLLSDEATIVQIATDGIFVHNSPFRSEILTGGDEDCVPLASMQLLHQSLQNNRITMGKADTLLQLMDKIFYWKHDPEETKTILRLLTRLVDQVPAYDLYFKKDNTFWELISS
jgi:hypothetical protein